MNRSLLAAVAAACALAGTAQAQDADDGMFAAKNFTATAILTSDYRFRGISNSDGFAFQGSLDWTHKGFNAGVFGSNTVFSDNNIEIDLYGGYSWEFLGLNWRAQALYYLFPGEGGSTSKGLDPPGSDPTVNGGIPTGYAFPGGKREGQIPDIGADYLEASIGVSKTFDIALSPTVGFTYNYSPDFFGEDGVGQHFQLSVSAALPGGFTTYANLGKQTVRGDEYSEYFLTPNGYRYLWWNAGVRKALGGFTLDLSWVDTDMGKPCGGAGQNGCELNGGFETFYNDFDYITAGGTSYRDLTLGSVVFQVSRTF